MEHLEGTERIMAEVATWSECEGIFDGTPMRCQCEPVNRVMLVRMRQIRHPPGYGATVYQCQTCKHPLVVIEMFKAT